MLCPKRREPWGRNVASLEPWGHPQEPWGGALGTPTNSSLAGEPWGSLGDT